MTRTFFITGTGTEVGKTYVAARLVSELTKFGSVVALKPYETGVDREAVDAKALAEASNSNEYHNGYLRAPEPLAPAAVKGGAPPMADILQRLEADRQGKDFAVVEGAGGILVPLGSGHVVADVITALEATAVLVTYDGLGTLSHTLTAWESARSRGIRIGAVVLNAGACETDPSQASNAHVLSDYGVGPIIKIARGHTDFTELVQTLKVESPS
ncbi:MAG: dethiobiotin synthase [Myxococcota bacterium]